MTEIVAQSALKREESRGGHYRTDHPCTSHHGNYVTTARLQEGEVQYGKKTVDPDWNPQETDLGSQRWG
jgi:succinate dehydrogenase/fumarate reductase flavoprotein subunit